MMIHGLADPKNIQIIVCGLVHNEYFFGETIILVNYFLLILCKKAFTVRGSNMGGRPRHLALQSLRNLVHFCRFIRNSCHEDKYRYHKVFCYRNVCLSVFCRKQENKHH